MIAADPRPPAGWIVLAGQLEADTTVAGYLARGQEVTGNCGRNNCRRRCSLERLLRHGYGPLPLADAKRLLRCNNLLGCGLDFRDDYPDFALRSLSAYPHARVRVRCTQCGNFRTAEPEAWWRKITGGSAEYEPKVREVVKRVKGPCKKCGKDRSRVDVLWPKQTTSR